MRAKHKQHSGKTVRFALLFFVFIFLVIIGSFVVKGIGVIQASLFDGKHRFTVLLQSEKEAHNVLLSFSPKENTASILNMYGKQIRSSQELSVLLGIPIDAFVSYSYNFQLQEGEAHALLPLVFSEIVFNYNKVKTNITFLDAIRLWMFAKMVPAYNISEKTYRFSSNSEDEQDTMGILDGLAFSLFADSAITEEKRSVHIINASGVSGLGNRVARIVTNMGGNVVAVTTGDSVLPVSEVAYSESEFYTVKKLQRLLQSRSMFINKQAISDIVVIIGKDRAELFTIQL